MKNPIQTAIAVAVLTFAGANMAMAADSQLVMDNLTTAGIDPTMLTISVDDAGTATISGVIEDAAMQERVVQTVEETDGIMDVIDNMSVSD